MKLPEEDVNLFYKLYNALMIYANKNYKIIQGLNSVDDMKKFSIEQLNKLRNKLFENPELIDLFVAENPFHFSPNELEILSSWKNFVKGKFIILRYLRNYTIFLTADEKIPKAYGVLALLSSFEEMVGPYLPRMVDAVLLPFKGKITYDGVISNYSISFGGGLRRLFNESYQEAKTKFGIITSLPFSEKKIEQTDADKLRFYLRSKQNRDKYSDEIRKLIKKNKELLTLYHQEMGKIHSRTISKILYEIGLIKGWFGIFRGMIIASGKTREAVERVLEDILPAEERKFVYIFQLKGRDEVR